MGYGVNTRASISAALAAQLLEENDKLIARIEQAASQVQAMEDAAKRLDVGAASYNEAVLRFTADAKADLEEHTTRVAARAVERTQVEIQAAMEATAKQVIGQALNQRLAGLQQSLSEFRQPNYAAMVVAAVAVGVILGSGLALLLVR